MRFLGAFLAVFLWAGVAWGEEDPCADINCFKNSSCVVMNNNPQCRCNAGYKLPLQGTSGCECDPSQMDDCDCVTDDQCDAGDRCFLGSCVSKPVARGGKVRRGIGTLHASFAAINLGFAIVMTAAWAEPLPLAIFGPFMALHLAVAIPCLVSGTKYRKAKTELQIEAGILPPIPAIPPKSTLRRWRYGGAVLLGAGYLFLASGIGLVFGAVAVKRKMVELNKGPNDRPEKHKFIDNAAGFGSVLIVASALMVSFGHVHRGRWRYYRKQTASINVSPFLTPIPGGGMVGVGGYF